MLSNNQDLSEQGIQDLSELLAQSPWLSIADELKEDLRDISENNLTVKGGLKAIKKWLISAKIILGSAANTLARISHKLGSAISIML